MIYSDEVTKIYLQVVTGVAGPKDEREEARIFREKVTRQVREAKGKGQFLEIPSDTLLD